MYCTMQYSTWYYSTVYGCCTTSWVYVHLCAFSRPTAISYHIMIRVLSTVCKQCERTSYCCIVMCCIVLYFIVEMLREDISVRFVCKQRRGGARHTSSSDLSVGSSSFCASSSRSRTPNAAKRSSVCCCRWSTPAPAAARSALQLPCMWSSSAASARLASTTETLSVAFKAQAGVMWI